MSFSWIMDLLAVPTGSEHRHGLGLWVYDE